MCIRDRARWRSPYPRPARRFGLRFRKLKLQIPSFNIQRSSHLQAPKKGACRFEVWGLEFPWCLEFLNMLEKIFKFSENQTNARTEILAGVTTFLTMAYI